MIDRIPASTSRTFSFAAPSSGLAFVEVTSTELVDVFVNQEDPFRQKRHHQFLVEQRANFTLTIGNPGSIPAVVYLEVSSL